MMLNYDFHQCCGFPPGREPFAISRVAVEQYQRSECPNGCTEDEGPWHGRPSLHGWTAACVRHVCERHSSEPGAEPKQK
jgi:hypothetical protein